MSKEGLLDHNMSSIRVIDASKENGVVEKVFRIQNSNVVLPPIDVGGAKYWAILPTVPSKDPNKIYLSTNSAATNSNLSNVGPTVSPMVTVPILTASSVLSQSPASTSSGTSPITYPSLFSGDSALVPQVESCKLEPPSKKNCYTIVGQRLPSSTPMTMRDIPTANTSVHPLVAATPLPPSSIGAASLPGNAEVNQYQRPVTTPTSTLTVRNNINSTQCVRPITSSSVKNNLPKVFMIYPVKTFPPSNEIVSKMASKASSICELPSGPRPDKSYIDESAAGTRPKMLTCEVIPTKPKSMVEQGENVSIGIPTGAARQTEEPLRTYDSPKKIQWHHPDVGGSSQSNFMENQSSTKCVSHNDRKCDPKELFIPDIPRDGVGTPDGPLMSTYKSKSPSIGISCTKNTDVEFIDDKSAVQCNLPLAFSSGKSDNDGAMRVSNYKQIVPKLSIRPSLQNTLIPNAQEVINNNVTSGTPGLGQVVDPQHALAVSVPQQSCMGAPGPEANTASSNQCFTWHIPCTETNTGKSGNEEYCFRNKEIEPPISINSKDRPSRDPTANSTLNYAKGVNEQSSGSDTILAVSIHSNHEYDNSLDNICTVNETETSDSMGLEKSPNIMQKRDKRRLKNKCQTKRERLVFRASIEKAPLTSLDKNTHPCNNLKPQDNKFQNNRKISRDAKMREAKVRQTWDADSNVLQLCIVRKTIHDCYSQGIAPLIDRVQNECYNSGIDLNKPLLISLLTSIGYGKVEYNSKSFLVEDCKLTNERIKYLAKVEKYRGRNYVYIFVSDGIKKICAFPKPACSILHAMSDRRLICGGLKLQPISSGFKQAVFYWLKEEILPQIPKGSVIIFGNHPVFAKDEEVRNKPGIEYSKEGIIAWLKKYHVPVKPNWPKSMLLSKVSNAILPKTSCFDWLVRENGFISLHLPKYHKELNPMEFLWHDVIDKVHQTSGIRNRRGFKVFASKEFQSFDGLASRTACDLVEQFESSYRDYDLKFDDFFERAAAAVESFEDENILNFPPPKVETNSSLFPSKPVSVCLVCLSRLSMVHSWKCVRCDTFWKLLEKKFKEGNLKELPVCFDSDHASLRPPACEGCRRFRFERELLRRPFVMRKFPNYHLPIPPVTEEGRNYPPIPYVI